MSECFAEKNAFFYFMPPESNLNLTHHSNRVYDLPTTETLPSRGCCSVYYQRTGKQRKRGGEESHPTVSSFCSSAYSFVS